MKSWAPHNPSAIPSSFEGRKQLAAADQFCFGCHSKLDCFTQCCADVTIMLTPFDVLRLARRTGLSTGEFLSQHTITPVSKELQLPVVVLKLGEDEARRCPFVAEEGCSVYEDRPWACRMYPIGMGIPPARAGEEPQPVYFFFEDAYCHGRTEGRQWSVAEWRENQGIEEREEMERGFREIVSHPWFIGGRQLGPKRMQMFHMACYDLDAFRRFVFESTFLDRFILEKDLIAELRNRDDALLQFAFRWLRYALFGEPTMTLRETAALGSKA
jgi:Fe-S-cluster containining protein